RKLEVLRRLDRRDDLLAGRHVAAGRVDRSADRVQEDLGAVVAREGVGREVFLRRELRLEVVDQGLVVRVLCRFGRGGGEVQVGVCVVTGVGDAVGGADAVWAEVRDVRREDALHLRARDAAVSGDRRAGYARLGGRVLGRLQEGP